MNERQLNDGTAAEGARTAYRPSLTFYHANARGTGAAVSMELHPAHDDIGGSIMMKIANQMTVGSRQGPNPTFARFDWENAITVKLDFNDLCQVLQVLRGECESVGEGRGLFHTSARAQTAIKLRHQLEPANGYLLEVFRKVRANGEESSARILLTAAEATGLCESIAGSMSVVGFGIPVVRPHGPARREKP